MSEISFREEDVLAAARAATGLSELGEEGFRPGLRVLLETYDRNAFSEKGRRRNYRRLVQLLSTRLRVENALRRHPEIAERPVRRPMVLTGLPRSGTSALFNLLAMDPAARPLRLWEAMSPDPVEDLAPGAPDPRREAIEAYYAKGREKHPGFTKIHYASADTPEECVLLHAYAFCGVQLGIEVMMEPYGSWFRKQDLRAMYRYERRLLQLLDWQRPGERWLLKAPAHMWGLDVLVETFPDVSVVWNHRDPLECVASACSLTAALMATVEDLDLRALGPVVMEFYAESLDRGLAARDRLDPARFADVDFDGLGRDPMDVVHRIYGHFDLVLPGDAEARMRTYLEANPRGKHGSHDYGLEEYGLSSDRVRERFASYIERFRLDGA